MTPKFKLDSNVCFILNISETTDDFPVNIVNKAIEIRTGKIEAIIVKQSMNNQYIIYKILYSCSKAIADGVELGSNYAYVKEGCVFATIDDCFEKLKHSEQQKNNRDINDILIEIWDEHY